MKHLYLLAVLGCPALARAQSVGIGTTSPAPSAALDVQSTGKGLLLPRLTEAQMQAIAHPEPGLLVFNTTAGKVYAYQTGGTSAGSVAQTASTGALTIPTGVGQTFTVPVGARLTSIAVHVTSPTTGAPAVTENMTLNVHRGAGVGGALLGSAVASVTFSNSWSVATFAFPGLALEPGQTYSFAVNRSSGTRFRVMYSTANPYAPGVLFTWTGANTGFGTDEDLRFEVHYTNAAEWLPLN